MIMISISHSAAVRGTLLQPIDGIRTMWKNVDEKDVKGVAPHPSTAATVDRTGHASDGQTRRRGGRSVVDTEAAAGETGTVVRCSAASGAGTTPHLRACCCRQFNIVNNIIGSGLLSLPWALRECGLFFGLVTMFGICCLNAVTIMVLARCCEMAGAYSYKEIGRRALGPTAGFVSQTIVAGYTLGSTISYIVLIGGARRVPRCRTPRSASPLCCAVPDFVPEVLSAWAPGYRIFQRLPVVLIVTFVALLPLSFIRGAVGVD